jgi:predicted acetyltransferase
MTKIEYKIATTKDEFEGIKDLCEKVFGPEEKELIHDLCYKSPKNDKNIYFYAYDQQADKCVGTVSLLDMEIKYGDVTLKTSELGIVATDPDYQGQGINKKLTDLFLTKAKEERYQMIAIEGIPYFYRRYGFNYAIPMGGVEVILDKIDCEKNKQGFSIRKATEQDLDFIAASFKEAVKRVDIATIKEKSLIKAQMIDYSSNTTKKKYFIIEEKGRKVGYFVLNSSDEIQICDILDNLSFNAYQAVINYFKDQEEKKINLDLPPENKFIGFVSRYGIEWKQWYSWQIKILDEFEFLTAIKDVLEQRISNSIYKDEKLEFYYDNFKTLIKFELLNGQLKLTEEKRTEAKWDFNLSPQGATKLFLGEKSRSEIHQFLPDCQVNEKYQELIDIMFPEMSSHFYMSY